MLAPPWASWGAGWTLLSLVSSKPASNIQEYLILPPILELVRPICVEYEHDLKNWGYFHRKKPGADSDIRAIVFSPGAG